MKNNIIATLGGLAIISVISTLSLSTAFATDTNTSQDNVAVNVPVSCTMNGTGMTSHNANIPNGTYQADIGTTTLKTFCNDNQGFAIYAIGYTNEEYGNTTLTGATGGQTIVTGTATTTGSPDVSNWAVKLATDSTATYPITLDNSFGAYSSVPSSYTKVAHRDSGTDLGSSATGASLTTTYAAYISKTQQADTYNGKVKYTLVHPASEVPLQPVACEAGKICYNANGSNIVGEMGKQSASNNASVILYASNFSRSGYGFAGWNDKFDYSGNYYGPNETITTPSDVSTDGLSLYAVWIKSAGSLQNWDGCNSLTQGATTALTDERDGNVYAVAKLADGKCWTIENLRLDDSAELSSANTHNPSLPLTNIYNSSTTSNHLSPTSSIAYNATTAPEGWCTSGLATCSDQSRLRTDNTTLFSSNTSQGYRVGSNVYSYGNYYNWYSATAGHGTYSKTSGDTAGDICPAGWHLPTGGSASAEFGALDVAMGGTGTYQDTSETHNRWRTYPNNFVYSGYVHGSSVNARYSNAYYSSSSANNSDNAYTLYFDSTSMFVYPGTSVNTKYYGWSVRCVAGN